jgi:hypothetical protein
MRHGDAPGWHLDFLKEYSPALDEAIATMF